MISFTGVSRPLTHVEQAYVEAKLSWIPPADGYFTGGAKGIDTLIHLTLAAWYPTAEHFIIKPAASWSGISAPGATIIDAPAGETAGESYMLRNDLLIQMGDQLIAFPETPHETLRSGTWATIRRARKAGIPRNILPLSNAPTADLSHRREI